MEQKQIDRINELARKAKTPEGRTEWEEMERAALRRECIDSVLGIAGCVCRNAVKLKNEIRHGQSNCIDTGFLAQMHLKCRRHFVKSPLVRHIDFSACIFLGRRSYVYNLSP